MIATYHNHTTFSDGKGTLDDMLAAATRLGVDELGISDHYVLHPDGRQMKWAMPVSRLDLYVAAVQLLQQKGRELNGPAVRLGLEVDWFPGHARAIRDALAPHEFDYLIGSVHDVSGMLVDMSAAAWRKLTQDQQNEVHRQYWINVRSLAEDCRTEAEIERGATSGSRLFDIVAHVDLTKKFGFMPTIDLRREIAAALDAIAAAGLVVEVNTNGWHKPCRDAYPTLEILRECRAREIAVTISADAHDPEFLVRDFAKAADRLRAAGYDTVARFAARQITFEPLEESF